MPLRRPSTRLLLPFLTLLALAAAAVVPSLAAAVPTTWTGAASSVWTDDANWSGDAPAAGDVATIPNVANDPVISAGAQAAHSVTLEAGAALTVSGGSLTVASEVVVPATATFALPAGGTATAATWRAGSDTALALTGGAFAGAVAKLTGVGAPAVTVTLASGGIGLAGVTVGTGVTFEQEVAVDVDPAGEAARTIAVAAGGTWVLDANIGSTDGHGLVSIEALGLLLHDEPGATPARISAPLTSLGTIRQNTATNALQLHPDGANVVQQIGGTLDADLGQVTLQPANAAVLEPGASGGTFDTSGGGTIRNLGVLTLDSRTITLVGSGFEHPNGALIAGAGTITGAGTMLLEGNVDAGSPTTIGARVAQLDDVNLDGAGGELRIAGLWETNGPSITDTGGADRLVVSASGTLRQNGGTPTHGSAATEVQIDGLLEHLSGTAVVRGTVDVTVDGLVRVDGGRLDLPDVLGTSGSTVLGTGTYAVTDAVLRVPASVARLGGTIQLAGTGAVRRVGDDAPALGSLGTIAAGGALTLVGGVDVTTTQPLTVAGRATLDAGSVLTAPSVTMPTTGSLRGIGTLDADLVSSGAVVPGSGVGTLTIDGDYAQGSGGRLELDVDGLGAGEHDQLDVTGSVALDGVLSLEPGATFVAGARAGDAVTLVDHGGARTGTFASVAVSPVLAGSRTLAPSYDDAGTRVLGLVADPVAPPTPVTPTPVAPAVVTAPNISGRAFGARVLTCNPGTWGGAPTRYAYAWTIGASTVGPRQAVGTARTLVVPWTWNWTLRNQVVACTVTATGAGGSGTATATIRTECRAIHTLPSASGCVRGVAPLACRARTGACSTSVPVVQPLDRTATGVARVTATGRLGLALAFPGTGTVAGGRASAAVRSTLAATWTVRVGGRAVRRSLPLGVVSAALTGTTMYAERSVAVPASLRAQLRSGRPVQLTSTTTVRRPADLRALATKQSVRLVLRP